MAVTSKQLPILDLNNEALDHIVLEGIIRHLRDVMAGNVIELVKVKASWTFANAAKV